MPEKIEVVPVHRNKIGGSRIAIAREQIEMRQQATDTIERTTAELQQLAELREQPPTHNLFKRFKQRRRLKKWLQRNNYTDEHEAHHTLSGQSASAQERHQQTNEDLADIWPQIRKTFGSLEDDAKKRGDTLLREFAPAELIESCDAQAAAYNQPANIIEWMSHTPTEDNPYGATPEQIEAIVLWNASHTEDVASNPEATTVFVEQYLANVQQKAATGDLDESWLQATSHIDRIVVGDILDARFLGYQGSMREGTYDSKKRTLTIWPYELSDSTRLKELVGHEVTHSFGGFETKWLEEGTTEMIKNIVQDKDPLVKNNVYELERLAVHTIITGAPTPISFAQISKFYPGKNHEQNEEKLRAHLKDAYKGYDVLTALNEVYDELLDGNSTNALNPEMDDDAAFGVLVAAKTIAGYFDIAQKDPQMLAQYLRQAEQGANQKALKIAYKNVADLFETDPAP